MGILFDPAAPSITCSFSSSGNIYFAEYFFIRSDDIIPFITTVLIINEIKNTSIIALCG